MKEAIRQRALELGFDACHFTTADPPETARSFQKWLAERRQGEMGWLERNAAKRVDPQLVLPGARSIVTLAVSYEAGRVISNQWAVISGERQGGEALGNNQSRKSSESSPTGRVARYARYTDYHDVLAERLKLLTSFLEQIGGENSRSLWYVDTGPLLERDLAQRSGLGFVGKHTNLISRKLGNWILLCEILTTLELEPDAPEHNRCGTCERCIQACPTGAITGPFHLDARRCISYLTIELKGSIPEELRPAVGDRIYGCDDCLAACPWNRFAKEGRLMREHARPDLEQPDLIELLSLDDAAFKQRFQGTPMLRTKRRGILRNVCVALGNTADERALPALERAANDPETLIAEHAAWAIQQIRQRAAPANEPARSA